MLRRTRYGRSSISLLIVGGVCCLITLFMAVMTAGFGADPVRDFKSAAITCDILLAILSASFYLAMFKWCGVGSVAMWSTALLSLVCCLASGLAGPTMLFTILLALQALICTGINSASTDRISAKQ